MAHKVAREHRFSGQLGSGRHFSKRKRKRRRIPTPLGRRSRPKIKLGKQIGWGTVRRRKPTKRRSPWPTRRPVIRKPIDKRKIDREEKRGIPPRVTNKDFQKVQTVPNQPLPLEHHWSPKGGWILDLNGDGKVDMEDYKIAIYPEHKKYIRDWILSHQFDKRKYLDVNQDGIVDGDDYKLAHSEAQKAAIRDYVEKRNGSLTGYKISGLIIHMVSEPEKDFIFDVQNEFESGLRGNKSGAIIRNIDIKEAKRHPEAMKKFGRGIGRPVLSGIHWQGDVNKDNMRAAIKVMRKKQASRFAKFFHKDMRERSLVGKRGTIFQIAKRPDSSIVDVQEIIPMVDENAYTLILSGDFEHGLNNALFMDKEELIGIGPLENKIKVVTGIAPLVKPRVTRVRKPRRRPISFGKPRIRGRGIARKSRRGRRRR